MNKKEFIRASTQDILTSVKISIEISTFVEDMDPETTYILLTNSINKDIKHNNKLITSLQNSPMFHNINQLSSLNSDFEYIIIKSVAPTSTPSSLPIDNASHNIYFWICFWITIGLVSLYIIVGTFLAAISGGFACNSKDIYFIKFIICVGEIIDLTMLLCTWQQNINVLDESCSIIIFLAVLLMMLQFIISIFKYEVILLASLVKIDIFICILKTIQLVLLVWASLKCIDVYEAVNYFCSFWIVLLTEWKCLHLEYLHIKSLEEK
jgi:hypothetical protein